MIYLFDLFQEKFTPLLHYVLTTGQFKVMDYMLEKGADINIKDHVFLIYKYFHHFHIKINDNYFILFHIYLFRIYLFRMDGHHYILLVLWSTSISFLFIK